MHCVLIRPATVVFVVSALEVHTKTHNKVCSSMEYPYFRYEEIAEVFRIGDNVCFTQEHSSMGT